MEVTEKQIRQWVRDEQNKILEEKQALCNHLKSGTATSDLAVICDNCSKELDIDEDGNMQATGIELKTQGEIR